MLPYERHAAPILRIRHQLLRPSALAQKERRLGSLWAFQSVCLRKQPGEPASGIWYAPQGQKALKESLRADRARARLWQRRTPTLFPVVPFGVVKPEDFKAKFSFYDGNRVPASVPKVPETGHNRPGQGRPLRMAGH